MDRQQVRRTLARILPEESLNIVLDQIFSLYDQERCGAINFRNFVMASHSLQQETVEQRLRFVFQLCDTKHSANITLKAPVNNHVRNNILCRQTIF